ncbi:hypothetical protein QO010_000732 [Caulobacter ginsengisoli]|uniref:SnoaL-like domain-containing protein n=1 Tax=Caulobacter ginsengisoli TaxID=400775 RepID=A0ABU0ILV5_9CAUL|nr:nuclear transport factor 2 family protein [Caulobacter ginsengisoli]MDQ0462984.1 hypothetical protein [Caulobacter ginsengisoli]
MEPLTAAALLFCSTAQPGPYPPASAVVDAFVQAYNRQDAKGIAAVVSQDAVILRGDQRLDGDELARNYRDNLFTMPSPYRFKVKNRLAQDNIVAETEFYTGGEEGEPPETILSVYEVKGGCIVRILASDPGDAEGD